MKLRITKVCAVIAASGMLAGLFSGCAWSIGEGKEHRVVSQPTRGQELMDLKKAKDQGAMTEEEYNNQRNQILNR